MTKRKSGRSRTKLDRAAGDAANRLNAQLAAFSAAAQESLQRWIEVRDDPEVDEPDDYLESAVKLADATATIAGAIARMKGERHQIIHVEHARLKRANATLSHHDAGPTTLGSQENSGNPDGKPGGEG